MKRIFIVVVLGFGVAGSTVSAATTGFNQTTAGPWDYNTGGNWASGTINGLWDSSLTLAAAQTVTFSADSTLATGLTFNHAGNLALTLRADGVANHTITLGGNITVATTGGTTANVTIGSATANQNLNVDLGGVSRTFSVAASRTLTLSNVVSNGSIDKTGSGTLTLSGVNTFAGGITLSAGQLTLGNNSALGAGTLTINGGTVDVSASRTTNNAQSWNGDFTYGGANGWNTGTGAITLGSSRQVTVAASAMTVGAAIGEAASGYSLTKSGAGTMILNAANTYSGGTTVNDGTLAIGASGNLGSNVSGNNVVVTGAVLNLGAATNIGSNQTLAVGSTSTSLGVLGLAFNSVPTYTQSGTDPIVVGINTTGFNAISSQTSGGKNIFLGSTGTGTYAGTSLTAGSDNVYRLGGGGGTLTVTNGVLAGSNNLTVGSNLANGGGTVILQGVNSLSGATTVNAGTLRLSPAGSLASSAMTVLGNSTLNFDSSTSGSTGLTRAASVTLKNGSLTVSGNSTANSTDTVGGAVTIDAGFNVITVTAGSRNTVLNATTLTRANKGVVQISGTLLGATPANGVANFTLSGATPTLLGNSGAAGTADMSIIPWAIGSGTAGSGTDFVTYDTNGFRALSGAEITTSISDGATTFSNVKLSASQVFTTTTTMNSLVITPAANTTISGGTLKITSGGLLLNPSLTNVTTTISSNIDFGTAEGIIGTASNRNTTISGIISGSGGLTVYSNTMGSPSASLTLSGANTYSGDTTIFGRVGLGASNAIPSGTGKGDLYLYGNLIMPTFATTVTINGLSGTGNINYGNTGAGQLLSIGNNDANGTFDGTITQTSNSFGIIKTGLGTQILTGINTYRGSTTITGGVLQVNSITNGGIAGSNNDPTNTNASSIGASNSAASNLVINGGTLRYVGGVTSTDRLFQVGQSTAGATGTIDSSGTGALAFTNTGNITYGSNNQARTLALAGTNTGNNSIAAAINNNGTGAVSVTKSGAGKWELSGTNLYAGATTVGAGTLLVSGTINSSSGVAVNGGTFNYTNNTTALNRAVTVAGGNFKYNSSAAYSGALTFTSGTISGTGNLSGTALAIGTGKVMAPGNSTGSQAVGATSWDNGGTFQFELNDATGTAGSTTAGWDLLNPTTLTLTASAGQFTLQIISLDSVQAAGLAANFSSGSSYSWMFVDAGSTITGFNANQFVFNTAGFQNGFSGSFSVSQGSGLNDDKLYLNYTAAIPEPSTYAMLALGLGSLWLLRRRRKA